MAVAELDLEQLLTTQEESQLAVTWRRFRRHKLAVLGLIAMSILILLCALAPVISPYDPNRIVLADRNANPTLGWGNGKHLLGADELGRDVLTRLLYAGRISLLVGFAATLGSELIGLIVGAVAGYFGGWVDSVLMRLVEFVITLPLLPVLLALSAIIGGSVPVLIVIMVLFYWPTPARLVRGMVLSLREQDFTEAARALGVSDWEIILRHMVPNSIAPIIVDATLSVGSFIILESALSFLGFGVQLPTATWGNMLQNVQKDMWIAPWKAFFPGAAIFITSLSFNFIGDGLRDALDPRLKL